MAEYVAAYFAARSILVQTAVCTSAGQALETPELELYQLAFLDVDMPNVNGMVLGRQLKQKCPHRHHRSECASRKAPFFCKKPLLFME